MTDPRPRAVLLDAAGTLIRPKRPVGEIYADVAARHGAVLTGETFTRAFRTVFPRMPPMAFPPAPPDDLDRLERGWWRQLVGDVLIVCDASVDDFGTFFTELYDEFAKPRVWEAYPEVVPTLAQFREAGLRLAVVSNFDSRLPAILEGLGMVSSFETVVFSTRAGAAKPDSAIFAQALAALGIDAHEAMHVGDNREADLLGAHAAGIEARLLVRGRPPAGPEEHADLGEFAEELLSGV